MSSVAVEASLNSSNRPASSRTGHGTATERQNGFSTLVDSNVTAASGHDGDRNAERAPRPARDDRPTARQTAAQNPADNTRRASRDRSSEPSATEAGNKPAAAASETGTRTKRNTDSGQTDAASQTADSGDEAQTTSTTTDAATAAQIALAAEATTTVDGGPAVPVANPPAVVVPTPAETAAAALNRVAADTGSGQITSTVSATAAVSTETATALLPATADGNVEAGNANVQTDPKAAADLAAATGKPSGAKIDDASHGKQAVRTGIDTPAQDGAQKPSDGASSDAPRPNTAEAKGGVQPHATADRLETDAPKAAKPAQDMVAPAPAAHAQSASDLLQPNGFGLSHVLAPHAATTVQAAQLTAVTANNTPVPLNGLAVEIVANAQIGRSRFEIRLDPPELGRIDVKLDVDQQGQVTSHLIVEKSSTLEMLRRDAPQLERALQDAGLKTSDSGLQFSLRDQSQSGRNDNNDTGRNAHRLHIAEEETIAVEPSARGYGRMIGQRGGVDIRV